MTDGSHIAGKPRANVVAVLSVGGEYASSIVFLVQQARKGRRALTRALAHARALQASCLARPSAWAARPACRRPCSHPGMRLPFAFVLLVGVAGATARR